MLAGSNIKLQAMPGTDDVQLVLVVQAPVALHGRGIEVFLDQRVEPPLADRPALMRTGIVPGVKLVAEPKDPDLHVTDGDHPLAAILELLNRSDTDCLHDLLTPVSCRHPNRGGRRVPSGLW